MLGVFFAACAPEPAPLQPDIVLVTLDTFRRDHMGLYRGAKVGQSEGQLGASLTPALDAFATDARVFDAAYTTAPTTAPAHVSMFTGLHPHEHGVRRNGDKVQSESVRASGLPRRLSEAGYLTAAFVSVQVLDEFAGLDGFGTYDLPPTFIRPGLNTVGWALKWWRSAGEGPRFLWVHLFDAHSPYGRWSEAAKHNPEYLNQHGWVGERVLGDLELQAQHVAAYAGGIQEVDAAFASLLGGLERSLGEEPGPLVCVVADHGEVLDELLAETGFGFGHGGGLGEAVLAVPLVLKQLGAGGRDSELARTGRVAETASVRDIYPTLLEAAGLRDEGVGSESRFNLLKPLPAGRPVLAQRRHMTRQEQRLVGITPARQQVLDANVVASALGQQLMVLGEDGTPLDEDPGSGATSGGPLWAAARAHLAEVLGVPLEEQDLSDEQREVLKALGYTR